MHGGRGFGRGGHHGSNCRGCRPGGPGHQDDEEHGSYHRGRGGGGGGGRGGGGHGGRRPPGLRGKDIGLFYARKSKENSKIHRSILTLSPDQRSILEDEIDFISRLPSFSTTSDNSHDFLSRYKQNLRQNVAKENRNIDSTAVELDKKGVWRANPAMAEALHQDMLRLQERPQYKRMLEFRQGLPAFKMKDELLEAVIKNQVLVVSGETGCGKTTQVPQFILDDLLARGMGDRCKIVCCQPRRISAISMAERVSEERGEMTCGGQHGSVGFQIRLEAKSPRDRGSILFCTTGVILQWMRSNPTLEGISHIILDEIHERDVLSDFVIAILKEDILPKRPDLKIILMSATLNANQFSKYFNRCATINIPGFTYPVKELYLEDVLELTKFKIFPKRSQQYGRSAPVWHKHTARGKETDKVNSEFEGMIKPYLRELEADKKYSRDTISSLSCAESEDLNHELVAALVNHIHTREKEGAILVFLPGWEDISKVNKLLTESGQFCISGNVKVYPLHSLMPTVSQREIFNRPPPGVRKIVIATNIAETSITIDDVVFVVDCGKIKMSNFDVNANIATLLPEWVSLANARQRRGRAGRVQPGICYHLYSRAREMVLDQFVVPEMLRTKLEELVLQIKILEMGKARTFLSKVMEPPSDEAIDLAIGLLMTINALDPQEQLTPLGFHLAHLPMDPQTGKMILLGAIFSCLDPVLSVAASLTFKDAFIVPLNKEEAVERIRKKLSYGTRSDHFLMANVLNEWEKARANGHSSDFCWDNFLSESTLRMLDNMKNQLAMHLRNLKFLDSSDVKAPQSNRNSDNEDLVRAVICAGLYPNVASVKVKRKGGRNGSDFPILRTVQEQRVSVHPKSVNSKEGRFKHPWMVYHLKMKTACTNIYDCSEVSPMALLFFGEHLKTGEDVLEDGQTMIETISIDKFVTFNCARQTSFLFRNLRTSLTDLLEYKVSNPGVTDWNPKKKEGALLKAIIDLFSTEPKGSDVMDDYSD